MLYDLLNLVLCLVGNADRGGQVGIRCVIDAVLGLLVGIRISQRCYLAIRSAVYWWRTGSSP